MNVVGFMYKSIESEKARINRLLAGYNRVFVDQFTAYLRNTTSVESLKLVRQYLEQGDFDAALRLVDQHVIQMSNVISRIFTDAAGEQALAMSAALNAAATGVIIGFQPGDPEAASRMENAKLEFITEFTRQQREATRNALTQGVREGWGTQKQLRAFRDSIGLTTRQMQAVNNYRRLLEEGSSEALTRALRDRRFDPTVRRTIEEGDLLSQEQIERMVDRYRARYLTYRAETIARTETLRVSAQAREAAMEQQLRNTGIARARVRRVWIATMDARTRDTHVGLNGQSVTMDEAFLSPSGALLMYPGDPTAPPEEIINCRCSVAYEID